MPYHGGSIDQKVHETDDLPQDEPHMPADLQEIARRLFKAAETLWTNTGLRPDQYAQPVLALIALRQMEAKFLAVAMLSYDRRLQVG